MFRKCCGAISKHPLQVLSIIDNLVRSAGVHDPVLVLKCSLAPRDIHSSWLRKNPVFSVKDYAAYHGACGGPTSACAVFAVDLHPPSRLPFRHGSSETVRGTAAAGLSHLLGHDVLGEECAASIVCLGTGNRGACSKAGGIDRKDLEMPSHEADVKLALAHTDGHDNECGGGSGDSPRGDPKVRRRLPAGSIISRVMSERDAPALVVHGLAEGGSVTSRRAFLNICNLIFWANRCSRGRGTTRGSDTHGIGKSEGDSAAASHGQHAAPETGTVPEHRREQSSELVGARGGKRRTEEGGPQLRNPLPRACESMLESQYLLPRLLRVAEHGEEIVLRAKSFLALRLALEVSRPIVLLKACRSRLLPLLARSIGALAPRAVLASPASASVDHANTGVAATAPAVDGGTPGLSPAHEYLLHCCVKLTDWLCTVPGRAALRLLAVLHRHVRDRDGVRREGGDTTLRRTDGCSNGSSGGGFRRSIISERPASSVHIDPKDGARKVAAVEAALATFPAVVHLINSPLLRRQAVTSTFISDTAGCLALACPVMGEKGSRRGSTGGSAAAATRAAADTAEGGHERSGAVVLAALLPTVETLAQQADTVLLPHWKTVSSELLPVLCRLLGSPSGDTRALAVAVFRVLLPPLLTQQTKQTSLPPPLSRVVSPGLGHASVEGAMMPTATARDAKDSRAEIQSAITTHLLPYVATLLRDDAPIPQYTIRLLLDLGREWRTLGAALLSEGDTISSLLQRLPAPLTAPLSCQPTFRPSSPPGQLSPPPSSSSSSSNRRVTSAAQRRKLDVSGRVMTSAIPAVDSGLAEVLAFLIEGGDDGSFESCHGNNGNRKSSSSVGRGSDHRKLLSNLLQLELPGRVAAAIERAVEAGMAEATEAFLSLATALLHAVDAWREVTHFSSEGAGVAPPSGVRFRKLIAIIGEVRARAAAGNRASELRSGWELKVEALLAAVPPAVEALHLFSVRDGVADAERQGQRQHPQRSGSPAAFAHEVCVDSGALSSVRDASTLFLGMCYKVRATPCKMFLT